MALRKSKSEYKGDALKRATERGKVSLMDASRILGRAFVTINAKVHDGEIMTVKIKNRHYVTCEELRRLGANIPGWKGPFDGLGDKEEHV